jgi:hypothetical protein
LVNALFVCVGRLRWALGVGRWAGRWSVMMERHYGLLLLLQSIALERATRQLLLSEFFFAAEFL